MQGARRLGEVLHTTRNGYIVVRLDDPERIPPLGVPVVSAERKRVGSLLDVIGPVKSPYAVVKPESKELLMSVREGDVLFYIPPRPRRPRRARKPVKQQRKPGPERRREGRGAVRKQRRSVERRRRRSR